MHLSRSIALPCLLVTILSSFLACSSGGGDQAGGVPELLPLEQGLGEVLGVVGELAVVHAVHLAVEVVVPQRVERVLGDLGAVGLHGEVEGAAGGVPETIGDFRILREIGRGGMGVGGAATAPRSWSRARPRRSCPR